MAAAALVSHALECYRSEPSPSVSLLCGIQSYLASCVSPADQVFDTAPDVANLKGKTSGSLVALLLWNCDDLHSYLEY